MRIARLGLLEALYKTSHCETFLSAKLRARQGEAIGEESGHIGLEVCNFLTWVAVQS